MTTLQNRAPYSSSELTTLYPPQLRLQLVQILLRHGERSPITARFRSAGLSPFWPYCSAVRHLRSAVLDPEAAEFTTLEWKHRLEAFGKDDVPVVAAGPAGELDAICDMGMLTDKGRMTTYELGKRLRNLYVEQLGFLPSTITDADWMYLRSTPIPRALESLQQTFQGLYPTSTRAPDFPPPTILARSPADETLFPNDGNCRRFAALSRAFAQRTATRWNNTDDMEYLNKKIGKWMPEGSPRVAVDSHPRLSGIMDTMNATDAHGLATRLPSEFYDPKVKKIIEKIGVEEWYSGYQESQEYRTLGIGGLLGDVVARMVGSVEHSPADGTYELVSKAAQTSGATPVRFGLSGCHDTTLAAVLCSLGAFDGEAWPPFTSHIAIELFRDEAQTATSSATTAAPKSWFSSVFNWGGASSQAGAPPPGIGRKRTPDLTKAEKDRLEGYYVRLRYNDKPMTVPGCKAPGKHLEGDESFCTLEAFKSIVDKFTPQNWKQECRTNVKAPAFPSKPEPAGF
ncbi:Fc.00g076420.m01.CDS01 [Cosmosporella sp. VM-42]